MTTWFLAFALAQAPPPAIPLPAPAPAPAPAPVPQPQAAPAPQPTALPAGAPSIDDPLRTGARSPADAAVVIGIEDYAFLPDVPYAERDAQAMEDLFVYTMGIPYDRVQRLGAGASKEKILAAVDEAASLVGPEGTLWLYYAGHGAASPSTGERMLLGVDTMADATSFEARAVPIASLKEKAADAHRTVLLVDACYAGASRAGQDLLAGKRFAVPAYVKPDTGGWIEWNAAQPNELSGPLEPARHGAFTFAVAGAFRGWADGQLSGEPDGVITLEEAQLFVGQTLRTVDIRDQRPDLAAVDMQASFVTLPAGKAESPPSADVLRALRKGAVVASPQPQKPVPSAPTIDPRAGERGAMEAALAKAEPKLEPEPPPEPPVEWPTVTSTVTGGSVGELICLSPGRFPMSQRGRWDVTLTRGVCLMKHEVTQEQWVAAGMKNRSDNPKCTDCPVGNVNWYEAVQFANQVSAAEGLTPAYAISGTSVNQVDGATGYRLPTRAEWNAAGLDAGRYDKFPPSWNAIEAFAWYSGNSGGESHPVCSLQPNGYGFCDLVGNVAEWVWDRDWDPNPNAPMTGTQPLRSVTDPKGPASGTRRTRCGGGYDDRADIVAGLDNWGRDAKTRVPSQGLRLARPAD